MYTNRRTYMDLFLHPFSPHTRFFFANIYIYIYIVGGPDCVSSADNDATLCTCYSHIRTQKKKKKKRKSTLIYEILNITQILKPEHRFNDTAENSNATFDLNLISDIPWKDEHAYQEWRRNCTKQCMRDYSLNMQHCHKRVCMRKIGKGGRRRSGHR